VPFNLNKLCAWRHDMPPPSVRRTLRLGRCGPAAAHPYACGAQRALLPIAVGSMNINELMNINDVRESATIFPRPCQGHYNSVPGSCKARQYLPAKHSRIWAQVMPFCPSNKLTFDLLTLRAVSESRVTWATCVPILVFLCLSVFELFPMYATVSQTTDIRQNHRLMSPPMRGGA